MSYTTFQWLGQTLDSRLTRLLRPLIHVVVGMLYRNFRKNFGTTINNHTCLRLSVSILRDSGLLVLTTNLSSDWCDLVVLLERVKLLFLGLVLLC